jgi:hypothetical protein
LHYINNQLEHYNFLLEKGYAKKWLIFLKYLLMLY